MCLKKACLTVAWRRNLYKSKWCDPVIPKSSHPTHAEDTAFKDLMNPISEHSNSAVDLPKGIYPTTWKPISVEQVIASCVSPIYREHSGAMINNKKSEGAVRGSMLHGA